MYVIITPHRRVMCLPVTRKAASVAVAQVDNVPVVKLSVDRRIVGKDAAKGISLRPEAGGTEWRFAPLQAFGRC